MVFSSHIFLFYFMPIFLGIYFLLVAAKTNISWINLFITVSSYLFYGWFEPWFVVLMWISTIVDYACGRAIAQPENLTDSRNMSLAGILGEVRSLNVFYPVFLLVMTVYNAVVTDKEKRRIFIRTFALVTSMAVNLGLLGFFKYYMFVADGILRLAEVLGAGSNAFRIMQITLPIGISFYTFQTMSYTIDVWRGDAPPVKDMRTFSCFVALFPQLIAGPIIRYNTVADQLANRKHSLSMFSSGAAIFMLGFAKKIMLANPAGEVADLVFRADGPSSLLAWWGALAYSFQIYFDFCAYSDMAVGLGRMMGFEFIKNFNAPYRAMSISDFWTRWHISLSTWIRDYLYISLGGNRGTVARTYFNLGLSMFLCGVWHGANWTFITWGVFHGVLLIWERTMGRQPIYRALPVIPKIILTNILVLIGWVVFRTPTMHQARLFWGAMFGVVKPSDSAPLLRAEVFTPHYLFFMIMCAIFVWQPFQAFEYVKKLTPTKFILIVLVFVIAIVTMFTQAFNPFLYFQF